MFGDMNTLDIPKLTEAQFIVGEVLRGEGLLVQEVYPHLSPAEREFILSGILPDEWDAMFAGDDREEGEEGDTEFD
jgi:hypothetical protein